MFDYTDVPEGPTMPGAHSIERYLVEESLNRIINAHYKNRKEWLVLIFILFDYFILYKQIVWRNFTKVQ